MNFLTIRTWKNEQFDEGKKFLMNGEQNFQ